MWKGQHISGYNTEGKDTPFPSQQPVVPRGEVGLRELSLFIHDEKLVPNLL